jgi:hypothetical protein
MIHKAGLKEKSKTSRLPQNFFLVPKPRLGNALAGEAPASRDGRRTEAGASGADAFPSRGLGTRKNIAGRSKTSRLPQNFSTC